MKPSLIRLLHQIICTRAKHKLFLGLQTWSTSSSSAQTQNLTFWENTYLIGCILFQVNWNEQPKQYHTGLFQEWVCWPLNLGSSLILHSINFLKRSNMISWLPLNFLLNAVMSMSAMTSSLHRRNSCEGWRSSSSSSSHKWSSGQRYFITRHWDFASYDLVNVYHNNRLN